jgi:hypothetical protein
MTFPGKRFLLYLACACAIVAWVHEARADQKITRADIENRRQELVVEAMRFSNKEPRDKFLQVYIPYQQKLMKILKARVKLVEQYAAEQKNGAISDPEAWKILGKSLDLDNERLAAEEAYVHQLKKVLPADQVLRAYQIETRINALYLSVVFDTVPLVR